MEVGITKHHQQTPYKPTNDQSDKETEATESRYRKSFHNVPLLAPPVRLHVIAIARVPESDFALVGPCRVA